MEAALLEKALSQGVWAVIAIFLFVYFVKSTEKRDLRQEEREKQLQEIISSLSDRIIIVNQIHSDIVSMKEKILSHSVEKKNN